jgi:hypothetical protein
MWWPKRSCVFWRCGVSCLAILAEPIVKPDNVGHVLETCELDGESAVSCQRILSLLHINLLIKLGVWLSFPSIWKDENHKTSRHGCGVLSSIAEPSCSSFRAFPSSRRLMQTSGEDRIKGQAGEAQGRRVWLTREFSALALQQQPSLHLR